MLLGYVEAIISGVIMAVLVISVHFGLQKRFKMEKAIFYEDREELFMIFPNSKDEKLIKYLHGTLDMDTTFMEPGQILLDLSELSVIFRIKDVANIHEKNNGENYTLYVFYDLIPYPYTGHTAIFLKAKCYENFDELIHTAFLKKIA